MKGLIPLSGDHKALHDAIIVSKRGDTKTRMTTMRPVLHRAFDQYLSNYTADCLEDQVALTMTKTQSQSCCHCYDVASSKRDELVAKIRSKQPRILGGTCQYCCIGKPNSIDHYLPKAAFPEFSVYALNLVPCCVECNTEKGNYWLDNQERAIINFYKDSLPFEKFLFAQLVYSAQDEIPITRFSANWSSIRNAGMRRRVKLHFERLKLLERYEEVSLTEIAKRLLTLRKHAKGAGHSIHRRNLNNEASALRKDFGNNFWQAGLCNAMADSMRFLHFIDA